MPEEFWIQDFETGRDRLRVHFVTERGEVKSILVIQHEAYVDRKWHAIVRYDEAHGFFIVTFCRQPVNKKNVLNQQKTKALH